MEEHRQNMNTWEALQSDLEGFGHKLTSALDEFGIQEIAETLHIDHVCVRLKNPAEIDDLKDVLQSHGQIISTAQISGREICMLQLNTPLQIGPWKIPAIEIPYPKDTPRYDDGWEHVEFVLSEAQKDNTPEGIEKAFFERFPNLSKETLQDYGFRVDTPAVENEPIPNPTVGIRASNGVGLKFHAHPIQEIVT